MASDTTSPKSKFSVLTSNGFVLGLVVGFAVGLAVDNLFVGLGLTAALGIAWYAGKRKRATV